MRKIRQVLRLAHEDGASRRSIAHSLGLSRDAVTDTLVRAAAAKLSWPLPDGLDDAQLEQLLFPPAAAKMRRKIEPDWALIHGELKRKGATLQALHGEYLAGQPDGVGYSHFCNGYRTWAKTLKRYLRQTHVAGERVFVDYAGPTMRIIDRASGEIRHAQIFVGVLGASNYTYAEAHGSQRLPDWIAAHTRMFEFFGGVPAVIVCDNLKSAVIKASRTEPVLNPAYQNLADHYSALVLPARPYKPKDKGKVENAVLVVERWIMFRLRNQVFGSLAELNAAIRVLLDELNARPFQKLPGSRRSTFESLDQPALKALPERSFEYAEFRKLRVGLDSRIEVDGCAYSVPFRLCRQVVDLRLTAHTLEILHQGQRVASHARSSGSEPMIDPQHLEPAHRHFGLWDANRELEWALSIGASVHGFLQVLLAATRVKEQGYRAALGLKKLEKLHGPERLEAACRRALEIGANALSSVRSILKNGLEQQPKTDTAQQEAAFDHPNVRGPHYYH